MPFRNICNILKCRKAGYVMHVDAKIPFTDDLAKISTKSGLRLSEEQKDLLDAVTAFNIKARYPDYKGRFYKKATKRFTENYLEQIKDFRKWLIKKVKE